MRTALMLGGPNDGAVIAVPPHAPVVVLAAPEPHQEAFTPGDDGLRARDLVTTTYVLAEMVLWGRALLVGVPGDMLPTDRDAAAARHLLSPLARNLLEGP